MPRVALLPQYKHRVPLPKAVAVFRRTYTANHYQPPSLSVNMEKTDTTERLAALRELMKKHEIDIYSTQAQ